MAAMPDRDRAADLAADAAAVAQVHPTDRRARSLAEACQALHVCIDRVDDEPSVVSTALERALAAADVWVRATRSSPAALALRCAAVVVFSMYSIPAGGIDEARLRTAAADAQTLLDGDRSHRRLVARVRAALAHRLVEDPDPAEGLALLDAALADAETEGDHETAHDAAATLSWFHERRSDTMAQIAALARALAAAEHLHDNDRSERLAELHADLGGAAVAAGRWDLAETHHRAAVAAGIDEVYATRPFAPSPARSHLALAGLARHRGAPAETEAWLRRAVEVEVRHRGPSRGAACEHLGSVLLLRGAKDEAHPLLDHRFYSPMSWFLANPFEPPQRSPFSGADAIRWASSGRVLDPEPFDADGKPTPGGVFSLRIFGPDRDFTCACGLTVEDCPPTLRCRTCGVEFVVSKVRGQRWGHIELPGHVLHPWRRQAAADLLGMPPDLLDAVLAQRRKITVKRQPSANPWRAGGNFTGVDAIRNALSMLDLKSMRADPARAALAEAWQQVGPESMVLTEVPVPPPWIVDANEVADDYRYLLYICAAGFEYNSSRTAALAELQNAVDRVFSGLPIVSL